ncbi:MAG: tetratricopeptide repeat protein [Oscillospiraceae bacterium]|jgi:tetratricopeptide (TPR) repeat protein
MNILFCHIAWMHRYHGPDEEDRPVSSTPEEAAAHRSTMFQFSQFNRTYYGYAPVSGDMPVEELAEVGAHAPGVKDVTVVWTAVNPETQAHVIVGWYRNAIVYRKYKGLFPTPCNYREYNVLCAAEDGCLLATADRTFSVTPHDVKGYVWVANEPEAAAVTAYIDGWRTPSASPLYTADELSDLLPAADGKSIAELAEMEATAEDDLDVLQIRNAICKAAPTLENHCNVAFVLQEMGYSQEALAVFQQAAELDSENLFLKAQIAECSFSAGQQKEALALYVDVLQKLELDPTAARYWGNVPLLRLKIDTVWRLYSIYWWSLGDKKNAVKYLRVILKLAPGTSDAETAGHLLKEFGF